MARRRHGLASRDPMAWLERWGHWFLLAIAALLLGSAGAIAWSEISFRRVAVETDGRVVGMITQRSRDRPGHSTRSYAPVFTFALPDGQEVRVESSSGSNPPCCSVGATVRVLYDPSQPQRAHIAGFAESWFLPMLLGGIGTMFGLAGLLARAFAARRAQVSRQAPRSAPPEEAVPLVGLRREETVDGPRWIVQARWTDPRSGATRLIESAPLRFDPTPQMRHMTTVTVRCEPAAPDRQYRMDLSFLHAP